MTISFDFDCTLGEPVIQKLATFILSHADANVLIITARNGSVNDICNKDLLKVSKRLGIPEDKIHLTNGAWKWRKVKELNVDIHFDDVPEECELICQNGGFAVLLWDICSKTSIKEDNFGKGIY